MFINVVESVSVVKHARYCCTAHAVVRVRFKASRKSVSRRGSTSSLNSNSWRLRSSVIEPATRFAMHSRCRWFLHSRSASGRRRFLAVAVDFSREETCLGFVAWVCIMGALIMQEISSELLVLVSLTMSEFHVRVAVIKVPSSVGSIPEWDRVVSGQLFSARMIRLAYVRFIGRSSEPRRVVRIAVPANPEVRRSSRSSSP